MALLAANKVLVEEKKVKDQLIQKGFGERDNSRLVLDLREALFLLEKDKIEIEDSNGEKVSFEELLKQAEKREKNFYNKFIVFRDVRDRGYVIKTGFKFGFDFRVYPRGRLAFLFFLYEIVLAGAAAYYNAKSRIIREQH